MDPQESHQALQNYVRDARRCLESGSRARALELLEAALAIDGDFLAAHTLRDRILAGDRQPEPAIEPPQFASAPALTRLEQRARQRRIEGRIAAASASLRCRKLADVRAALDEIRELDPDHPAITPLEKELDTARRNAALDEIRELDPDHPAITPLERELDTARHNRVTRRAQAWSAAGVALALVVFGISRLDRASTLVSPAIGDIVLPPPATAELPVQPVASSEPPLTDTAAQASADTAAQASADTAAPVSADTARQVSADTPRPVIAETARQPIASDRSVTIRPIPPSAPRARALDTLSVAVAPQSPAPEVPVAAATLVAEPALTASAPVPPLIVKDTGLSAPAEPAEFPPAVAAAGMAPAPPADDQDGQIRQVLEKYRAAYEGLDARSAREVWPGVNEGALAKAFDGLESQRLTFDACQIQARGVVATAACSGSARYVTKVGNRSPRVEPRSWVFTLRKSESDWMIDQVRARR